MAHTSSVLAFCFTRLHQSNSAGASTQLCQCMLTHAVTIASALAISQAVQQADALPAWSAQKTWSKHGSHRSRLMYGHATCSRRCSYSLPWQALCISLSLRALPGRRSLSLHPLWPLLLCSFSNCRLAAFLPWCLAASYQIRQVPNPQ
jgi:hypothetical protein